MVTKAHSALEIFARHLGSRFSELKNDCSRENKALRQEIAALREEVESLKQRGMPLRTVGDRKEVA